MQWLSKSLIQVTQIQENIMSKITVSDLAFDSKSFINEIAETESTSVNGGGIDSQTAALLFLGGLADFGKSLLSFGEKITGALLISSLLK